MNALLLLELLVLGVFLLMVLTQWAIPFWRGTQIFPIFHGERRIERDLERVRQRRVETELEQRFKREAGTDAPTGGLVSHDGSARLRIEERHTEGEGNESVPTVPS